jgi:hypothetical protein
MAAQILGRRPIGRDDYAEAFNLERIDLISEIPDAATMLKLGSNIVGPRDGLYILDDGGTFRIYVQEHGVELEAVGGLSFDRARDTVVDRVIQIQGLPFEPPG